MGVYIKGMEMPTSCWSCPFFHTSLHHIGDDKLLERYTCLRTGERAEEIINGRMGNCPLAPVPPHGRLIESAELYGKVEDIKTKAMSVSDKPQSWQFGVFWAVEQIEAALTNAPTIIPAEEGEC